jgi:hypothetical protein
VNESKLQATEKSREFDEMKSRLEKQIVDLSQEKSGLESKLDEEKKSNRCDTHTTTSMCDMS